MNRFRALLGSKPFPWLCGLIPILLGLPSLWLGWQGDDYMHRAVLLGSDAFPQIKRSPARLFAFVDHKTDSVRNLMEIGAIPWWTSEGFRISFFRPITGLTHALDYRLWPDSPMPMHVHSLLWAAATAVAVAFLFRRWNQSAWIAGVASLLFAVDDAHGMPTVWLANRNMGVGMLFGTLCLLFHDSWRRNQWRAGIILAPLSFILGLLSNEGAVAIAGYLLAYSLFMDTSPWSKRLRGLVPYLIVGGAWAFYYRANGCGVFGSGVYIDPGAEPLRFAAAVLVRAPLLLLGQLALPPSESFLFISSSFQPLFWLMVLLILTGMGWLITSTLRRDAVARFWFLGMSLAIIPACSVQPADRLLYFIGLGGMGLLARCFNWVWPSSDPQPVTVVRRLPIRITAWWLVGIHGLFAPLNLLFATTAMKRLGTIIHRSAETLPSDDSVRRGTVVVVHAPSFFLPMFSLFRQIGHGITVPGRLLTLGSGIYQTEISRPQSQTLVVKPDGGFLLPPGGNGLDPNPYNFAFVFLLLDRIFRDDDPPFYPGQRIELSSMTVEVVSVTAQGRPESAAFHFKMPLDDPSFRWLIFDRGSYVPFSLPDVGETVVLPGTKLPW